MEIDMTKMTDAAEAVENLVNENGHVNLAQFVRNLTSMHRTLQQKFTGEVVIPFVRELAHMQDDGLYDARNAYACRVCKAMLKGLEAEFPYIADGECTLPLI